MYVNIYMNTDMVEAACWGDVTLWATISVCNRSLAGRQAVSSEQQTASSQESRQANWQKFAFYKPVMPINLVDRSVDGRLAGHWSSFFQPLRRLLLFGLLLLPQRLSCCCCAAINGTITFETKYLHTRAIKVILCTLVCKCVWICLCTCMLDCLWQAASKRWITANIFHS